MDGLFTVVVIDGEASEMCEPYTNLLRYDGLTWADSVELVRLSFAQGFQAVIWRQEGGTAECGEA